MGEVRVLGDDGGLHELQERPGRGERGDEGEEEREAPFLQEKREMI